MAFTSTLLAQPGAIAPPLQVDKTRSSIPVSAIMNGGPPPQGIPALGFEGDWISRIGSTPLPHFISVNKAINWLEPKEPVLLLAIKNEARIYPLQILTWHEIVNDNLQNTPVAVTFCPLCNTALVFDRRVPLTGKIITNLVASGFPEEDIVQLPVDFRTMWLEQTGKTTPLSGTIGHFGTSGKLYQSNMLMFDTISHSLWSQAIGEATVGTLTGAELLRIPAQIVSFFDARTRFPDAQILSRKTGFTRAYGTNPYQGFDSLDEPPFFSNTRTDPRLDPMERVLIVQMPNENTAYPFSILQDKHLIQDKLDELEVVLFWQKGTVSALDEKVISKSHDVGSAGIFIRRLNGKPVHFEYRKNNFYDLKTGSQWNHLGYAVDGPLKGTQLISLPHDNSFWFAWAAFRPDTRIYRP